MLTAAGIGRWLRLRLSSREGIRHGYDELTLLVEIIIEPLFTYAI